MAETFKDLKLSNWIINQLNALSINKPTPIQSNCIPHILAGKDCIGCAKTGSGKTLAFVLPILEKLFEDPYGIFCLVLTPTRELAQQIAEQFLVIGNVLNLELSLIVGGLNMVKQGHEMYKKPHILVATPGRLADHLESCNTFSLSKVKFLVLDEADRLLGGEYDEHLKVVFDAVPKKKQILMFSATLTDTLQEVQKVTSNDVFVYVAPSTIATVEQLKQLYVLCPNHVKDGYLVHLVRKFRATNPTGNVMIFTDTCLNCQLLSMTFNSIGIKNVRLNGLMRQRERFAALATFKSNQVRILIATDVASRGLDIPTVELVINHSIPMNPKIYIHRVGRTARAGRGGTSISLVAPQDVRKIHAIEELTGVQLEEHPVDDSEVLEILAQIKVTKRNAEMEMEQSEVTERKLINKRKHLIEEGIDPDVYDVINNDKKSGRQKKKNKRRKKVKQAELSAET